MAKKIDEPKQSEPARPVIAVEFNGELYPSFQQAEGARAKADLMSLLIPARGLNDLEFYDHSRAYTDSGRRDAIDRVIREAERVHGILSRYLDAAKVSLPTDLR